MHLFIHYTLFAWLGGLLAYLGHTLDTVAFWVILATTFAIYVNARFTEDT